jgi:hypothetical protein
VPTLLMWGEKDAWIPLDIMRKFQRDLPYSDFIVYEGVGHLPMEELPVQTARDVDNFFMAELKTPMQHAEESGIKYYDGGNYKQIAPEHLQSAPAEPAVVPNEAAEPTAVVNPAAVEQNPETPSALTSTPEMQNPDVTLTSPAVPAAQNADATAVLTPAEL